MRRVSIVLVLMAITLTLVACGGGGGSAQPSAAASASPGSDPAGLILSTLERSSALGTARCTLSMSIEADIDFPPELEARGEIIFPNKIREWVDAPDGSGGTLTAEVIMPSGGEVFARVDDGSGPTPWERAGKAPYDVTSMLVVEPYLESAHSVAYEGTDHIGGRLVDGVYIDIDLYAMRDSKYAKSLIDTAHSMGMSEKEIVKFLKDATMETTYWVGREDGLLYRQTANLMIAYKDFPVAMSVSMDFMDYGAQVEPIEVPTEFR